MTVLLFKCFRQNFLKRSFCYIAYVWNCDISHQYPDVKKDVLQSARLDYESCQLLDYLFHNHVAWKFVFFLKFNLQIWYIALVMPK